MSASTTMQRQLQRTRDNERRHSTATHPNSDADEILPQPDDDDDETTSTTAVGPESMK